MKPHKGTMLIVLLGLLLAAFVIGLAQNQNTQAKKEAGSSMDSCCCKGDSCEMKEGMSSADKKAGCCGESCDMKKDASMKNHPADAGCCCCAAESCDMKTSESMNSQSSADNCCCNKMDHKNMQQMKAKQKAA